MDIGSRFWQSGTELMATACGKVILLGEHAVVYGRPALAGGFLPGAEAQFLPGSEALKLTLLPADVTVAYGGNEDLARAFKAAVDTLQALRGEVFVPSGRLEARLHLPAGGGVGSSAALGVASARALAPVILGRDAEPDELVQVALAWEQVFHGNPSGVDHAVATHGGVGTFLRTVGFRPVRLQEPLKILFADTGERVSTKEMVERVARQWQRRTASVEQSFDAIASLVRNAVLAVEIADYRTLGQLMNLNQQLLSSLLLSTERTETLCRAARDAGAHGAKLTGGGGGGCVIAIPGKDPACEAAILTAWRALGAPTFTALIESSLTPSST